MSEYNEKDMQAVREALAAQLANVTEHIRSEMSESEQNQFNAILGRSTGDSSDEALAVTLGDLSAARLNLDIRQWQALKEAEQRLGSEDFGACADCGATIPVARLVANPAARRCVACQTAFERTHGGGAHGSL